MSNLKPSDEIRSRYWDTNDRLSDARLAGNKRRVELLTYGAEILASDYRAAKAKEPSIMDEIFGDIFKAYGFPSIRPAQ